MGLFSKKKPKDGQPAAGGAAPQAMPSLGLPVNNPAGGKHGTPAAAPPAASAPKPVKKDTATVSADSLMIPKETPGAPTTFELPDISLADVKLEETGFIESPSSGTGSMSLVVEHPDIPPEAMNPAAFKGTLPAESTPPVPVPAPAPVPAADATPSISLTPPDADSAPAMGLASESTPPLGMAAPVTEIATPGMPAKPAEFKPPNVTLDTGQNAPPTPEGLKSQVLPARAFRVVISTLHRLSFKPNEAILKAKQEAKLSNISTSGAGLVATDFIRPPAMNALIQGSLVFESGTHPVQLEVMHVTSGVIGCRFVGEKLDGLREAIKKYFELELLALGMLKVNPAHHKAEADGNAHWIHGDQCELFYVTDAGNKLVRFRLTFLGNRFVWTKAGGLNVGQVIDDRVGMMRTDRIAVMEASAEIVELAARFLQNIPQVPQEHRDQIAAAITTANVKAKAS